MSGVSVDRGVFRRLLIMLISNVIVLSAAAQDASETDAILNHLQEYISDQNVERLMSMASEPLDIAVFGASQSYSTAQGRYVLERLFAEVDVASFSIVEYEKSDSALFVEGRIDVPNAGYAIRVYLRMNKHETDWSLREILFERKKE